MLILTVRILHDFSAQILKCTTHLPKIARSVYAEMKRKRNPKQPARKKFAFIFVFASQVVYLIPTFFCDRIQFVMPLRKNTFAAIFFVSIFALHAQDVRHNPWELIIYRPENSFHINQIRCRVSLEDENGNDVTRTSSSATYEWVSIPGIAHKYQGAYFLLGGMAMHLNLRSGKYKIKVFTLPEDLEGTNYANNDGWHSNDFFYDTQNPAKVIFVSPTANQNGFYDGGWKITAHAPKFFQFTKPAQKK